LQRLQVLVWPDRPLPWRKPGGWPDGEARERAYRVYERLDALTPALVLAQEGGPIPFLTFTPEAQLFADHWRDALEGRLRSDELEDTPAFAAHLAKYRSLMPTLALIFEMIAIADGEHAATGQVGEAEVRLATAWCEFLEYHARKLYAAALARGELAAHLLAAKIRAGAIRDGGSIRDISRHGWAGLGTSERVLLGANVLADHGWLRLVAHGDRRPSQVVRLHPNLHSVISEDGNRG
jgi:hypothetical protein